MEIIKCEICHVPIHIESENYLVENKIYYHKECYFQKIRPHNNLIYWEQTKKYGIFFIIFLPLFVISNFFYNYTGSVLLSLVCFALMALTISFGITAAFAFYKYKKYRSLE